MVKDVKTDGEVRNKSNNGRVITCGNVVGCNKPIGFNDSHINVEERTFCCYGCVTEYLDSEARLEHTAESGRGEYYEPLNYREHRPRYYGARADYIEEGETQN